MAKPYRIVKLVSEEGTGDYYTTTKPTRGLKAVKSYDLKNMIRNLGVMSGSRKFVSLSKTIDISLNREYNNKYEKIFYIHY